LHLKGAKVVTGARQTGVKDRKFEASADDFGAKAVGPLALALDDQAIAVLLDFVNPIRPGRNLSSSAKERA
jgi:hypothetical protein